MRKATCAQFYKRLSRETNLRGTRIPQRRKSMASTSSKDRLRKFIFGFEIYINANLCVVCCAASMKATILHVRCVGVSQPTGISVPRFNATKEDYANGNQISFFNWPSSGGGQRNNRLRFQITVTRTPPTHTRPDRK